jgi:hypothetical protein
MAKPPYPIIATSSPRTPRYGLMILGGLVLAGAGVAAVVMLRPAGALPETTVVEALAPAPVATSSAPLLARSASVCTACGTVASTSAKGGNAYEVRVRMDDGSLRSFNSTTQPQPGTAVRVEGEGFRVVGSGG